MKRATISVRRFTGVNKFGQDIARTVFSFVCPVEEIAIHLKKFKETFNFDRLHWVEVDGRDVNV